ncbi:MAG: hypothetical protein HOO86_05630 [Bacteroidales bacterium]|nr:hypothetical protein [Bacteroidales bacterium]
MIRLFTITTLFFVGVITSSGQSLSGVSDSIYASWWENKDRSIFKEIDNGTFSGTTTGYLQLKNGKDTILLDFQLSKTTLDILRDSLEMYDNSTKRYITQTTSGKTTLTYESYALANVFKVLLNGLEFRIGAIDGACDLPIRGLRFNYCLDKNIEYLTLFVTDPIELSTVRQVMELKKMNYPDAKKQAKTVTLLSGSTLILTIQK